MSWDDHYRRRAAITSVLTFAAQHPGHGLGYDHLPEVRAQFRTRRDLVLALQYDWSQALWARTELISIDPKRCHLHAAKLAALAWAEAAERTPVLRRLLDEHHAETASSVRRQEEPLFSSRPGLHRYERSSRSEYAFA